MDLQGIQDILRGASSPQLQQSPSPQMPIPEEVYPDNFFDDDEEETFNEQSEDPNFQANLAEGMSESYLTKLSTQFRNEIDDDETDRQPWMDMVSNVQAQIGIGEESNYEEPFPGCSSVVYPLFVKAQIQFTARAMPEIFPNDPVKGVILGDTNEMLEEQSERVADVMNYQYQYQDPDNKKDFARMLTWLPYVGSAFRYASHDPITNKNIVRYIPAGDLIVAYATTSLTNAYRITHRFRDSKNDILKLQQAGFYRDVELFADNTAVGDDDEEKDNSVRTLRDTADGSTPDSDSSTSGQNQTCFNIYTYCDLEGYEDCCDKGEMTGIALPYVFTMHEATGKILAIRRNWKQDDEYKTQRIYFAHYKYHEGLGFYGAGLPHLIGSIQTAITGALRSFGDSMAFSIMQGGFKLKSCKISGSQKMGPGDFLDVDAEGVDDVGKAIKPMNFPAPTPQVLQYIELLTKVAEDIISIGDLMTGDQSSQNAPVGSTLAIIEQATKVISAQHKSLIESLSEEFRIMYDLNYDFLPDEDQFVVPGKAGVIRRSDFDGKVGVIPTADPSVSSFQQRQAIDQATMQLSQVPGFSQYFKEAGYPLLRRMLKNLNVPDLDGILLNEEEVQQQQLQQQQNPQPNPDQIKAQVMQQDSQTKAQTAQANAQQMQADGQLEQAKLEIEKLKLALQEKQIDMKYATDDKMIDARFLGTVAPALQQSSDALAMQNIGHEQEKAIQQQDQQHQMTMQRMQAAQAAQQQASAPMSAPAEGKATPEAPDPQAMHDQMMAAQHGAAQAPPATPDKQGMLMQLMNKIRGR